jgi:flagellar biosynthesis protein FlhF
MHVKKFEAKTMKDALELVKKELGPEAVILSARDNKKGFGLAGEMSVEVTAAISEVTLRKKQFTESKLLEKDKLKFQNNSAKQQKELIEKVVNNQIEKSRPRPFTAQRYIDIESENQNNNNQGRLGSEPTLQQVEQALRTNAQAVRNETPKEVMTLKSEIQALKSMLVQFQSIPQNIQGSQFSTSELRSIYEKLCDEQMNPLDAQSFVLKAQHGLPQTKLNDRNMIEGWIARLIMEQSLIADYGLDKKIHVFWGPPGVGKTTTLVKLAAQWIKSNQKKIALITLDTLKVGATDQLKICAQILNAPFAVLKSSSDWNEILQYLDSVDYIFVDSPGQAIQLRKEAEYCQNILGRKNEIQKHHLVLSATYPRLMLQDLINRADLFSCDDLIVTHLDECKHFGGIYSLMLEVALPIHSFGLGTRMPNDFELATKERILDLIFHITRSNQNEFTTSR